MRSRPIFLVKACPVCGGRGHAEAKLPMPANAPAMEFDLDNIARLVDGQSISLLLALVELLPYKQFTCRNCQVEFKLESRSAKDLVQAMLSSMQPVVPTGRPGKAAAPRRRATPVQPPPPAAPPRVEKTKEEWESESLDALLDYDVTGAPRRR